MYSLLFLGIVSFVLSLLLTPLVRNAFRKWGLVDHPNAERKQHQRAVPRIGGIPLLVSYLCSFGLLLLAHLSAVTLVKDAVPFALRFLPAVLLIFATGLLDDLIGLKPWQKLAGQMAAAGAAYWAGVHVQGFGGHVVADWLSLPLTLAWLVLCTNAMNLIDGVDGLAAGVGLFAAATTLLAALLQQNFALAIATMPLVGCLLGFLRYNFNPATIFLGDSGSLLVGFLLGCLRRAMEPEVGYDSGDDRAADGAGHSAARYGALDRSAFPEPQAYIRRRPRPYPSPAAGPGPHAAKSCAHSLWAMRSGRDFLPEHGEPTLRGSGAHRVLRGRVDRHPAFGVRGAGRRRADVHGRSFSEAAQHADHTAAVSDASGRRSHAAGMLDSY